MRRFAPPTSTSPEVHTEIEKNATAVSRDRNEPMTRPCTPRCAEEDTALLVPLRGPNSAIGARISEPEDQPGSVADRPSRNDSPNRIGNAAEHDGGDGVGAAEDEAEQIERARGALVVGNGFDAVGLDLGGLGRCGDRGGFASSHDDPCASGM